MSEIKNKNILNIIFLFSIFALLAAYFIEYILGHQPCNLCLIERIPYILTIIIISLIYIFKKNEKIYIILLSLIFISATLISFYHFGIEQGFIEESLICDLNNENKSLTKEELLKELKEKTISCKDVTFRILGLSLATINTIISLLFSIITLKIFLNYEKDKNKNLEQYNKIDISLDTFPYNGNTTSFESIWMGVPVLTLKGNNFISRCGYSINKNLNLEQLIAKDKKDYIEKAINLASSSNLKNLNTLRNSLRKKAMVSPLFNTSELAENFSKELIKLSNRDHS